MRGIRWRRTEAIAACVLFLFFSCGKDDGRTTVRFWQFWDVGVVEPLVEEFEKRNPGIDVRVEQLTWKSGLEKIQAAVASGRSPDLCELGSTWVPRFSYEGVLEDLTPLYRERGDDFIMWESGMWNGRVYALPWVQGSRVLFYNRALFVRAGLDPDAPPRTWDELMESARRIASLGSEVMGFGLNMGERYVLYKKFMPFAWSNGGGILSPDMKRSIFASRENLEALEFYLELAEYSLKEKQEVLDHYFKQGRLGMQISGAWNLRNYAVEAPDLDFGVAPVPAPSGGGRHVSFAGAEMLVIFRSSRAKDAAIALAEFLQDYERAKRISLASGSVFPASKRALDDPVFMEDEKLSVFVRQSLTSRTVPAHPGWLEMEEAINRAVEEAVYGRTEPGEALEAADGAIQAVIERFEKDGSNR